MTDTATALKDCLISDVEHFADGTPANVADGLFAIARALNRIASNMETLRSDHPLMGSSLDGLGEIADAIAGLKK